MVHVTFSSFTSPLVRLIEWLHRGLTGTGRSNAREDDEGTEPEDSEPGEWEDPGSLDNPFQQIRRMNSHRFTEIDENRDGRLAFPKFNVVDVLAGDFRLSGKLL